MKRALQPRPDRRGLITRALYRCISEQGYANTTLKDIADRAEMSPSHVGYYFNNKVEILEGYAELVCRQNLAALPDVGEPDLERLIDELATFCLGEGQMTTGLLGVIQELTGLAVHDPRLFEIKAQHTEAWREYLEALFGRVTPANGLSAREAAWLAHAILVGLNTNTLFDSDLDREVAHDMFRRALRTLAGLDTLAARPRVRGRSPAKRSGSRRRRESR